MITMTTSPANEQPTAMATTWLSLCLDVGVCGGRSVVAGGGDGVAQKSAVKQKVKITSTQKMVSVHE